MNELMDGWKSVWIEMTERMDMTAHLVVGNMMNSLVSIES